MTYVLDDYLLLLLDFSVHSPLALAILSAKQAVFPQSNSTTQLTPQCHGSGAFLGLVRCAFDFLEQS